VSRFRQTGSSPGFSIGLMRRMFARRSDSWPGCRISIKSGAIAALRRHRVTSGIPGICRVPGREPGRHAPAVPEGQ
jgi:hypothetical protein